MEMGLDACGLVLAAEISTCGLTRMGFVLMLVVEIGACGLIGTILCMCICCCGSMLVVEIMLEAA